MLQNAPVAIYIGIVFTALIIYCFGIVFYYAEPGFPWHTYITITIGYFISYAILFLVPVDIASCVIYRRDADVDSYENVSSVLYTVYNTLFTTVLIMGSFVLTYEEYYNTDG